LVNTGKEGADERQDRLSKDGKARPRTGNGESDVIREGGA